MRGIITGLAGAFVAIAKQVAVLPPVALAAGMVVGFASVALLAVFLN